MSGDARKLAEDAVAYGPEAVDATHYTLARAYLEALADLDASENARKEYLAANRNLTTKLERQRQQFIETCVCGAWELIDP